MWIYGSFSGRVIGAELSHHLSLEITFYNVPAALQASGASSAGGDGDGLHVVGLHHPVEDPHYEHHQGQHRQEARGVVHEGVCVGGGRNEDLSPHSDLRLLWLQHSILHCVSDAFSLEVKD